MPPDSEAFDQTVSEIIRAGRILSARGWVPATSGNLSMRIDNAGIAITASGVDKGALTANDILRVDSEGRSETGRAPSAEALLHWEIYERDPTVLSVLHGHTIASTVCSRILDDSSVVLEGYELLKAFSGIQTHEAIVDVPIIDNDQDMRVLARVARERVSALSQCYGYLVRGHGVYAWGHRMSDALRHFEALDFLLECWLRERSLR